MCKKIPYPTKNKAKIKEKELEKRDRIKRQSYYCEICKSFHITRQKNSLIEQYFAKNEEYKTLINLIKKSQKKTKIEETIEQFTVKIDDLFYVILFNTENKTIFVSAILR